MASSVESRVPYLDHNLVEFAVNVPTEQKIHGTLTKIILREAMKPYLPDEIYRRTDKIGFSTPIEEKLSRNEINF
jgi:asparagine synthase (glutamine-hydrolysing)